MNRYEKEAVSEQGLMEEAKRQRDSLRVQQDCASTDRRNMVSEIEEALDRVQSKVEAIHMSLIDNANRLLGEDDDGKLGSSAHEGYPGELGQIVNRLNRLNERLVDAEHQSRRFYSA